MEMVSVIIPTYKGSSKLSRAINSVLVQTYPKIEIIVVDDNEPNTLERRKTEKIIRDSYISVVTYIKHNMNKNGAAARNTGIVNANGEYITFLDDDDFMMPNRIKKSVDFLQNNPDFGGVCCNVHVLDGNRISFTCISRKELQLQDILENDMILGTGSNIFIRRDVIDTVKEFDKLFYRHQDLEFMLRVVMSYKVGGIDYIGLVKSQNDTNNNLQYKKMYETKKNFTDKFHGVIRELSEAQRKAYFLNMYHVLFFSALKSDKQDMLQAKKNLQCQRPLTIYEKIRYDLAWIGISNTVLFRVLARGVNHFLSKKIEKNSLEYILYTNNIDL